MPPKRDADEGGGGASKKSRLTQKTAAEFFAENKHFAGAISQLYSVLFNVPVPFTPTILLKERSTRAFLPRKKTPSASRGLNVLIRPF